MDIGKGIQEGFNIYLKNFVLLFLASLVVMIGSAVTIGILAGPLFAGMMVLCLKLLKGESAQLNDVFSKFDKFLPTFLLVLMMAAIWLAMIFINAIPILGILISLALLILSPAIAIIFYFALGFIVTKDSDAVTALKQGINCFMSEPVMAWVYSLVLLIIAGVIAFIPAAIFGAIFGAIFAAVSGGLFLFSTIYLGLMFLINMACSAISAPVTFIGMTAAFNEVSGKEVAEVKIEKQTIQIVAIVAGALVFIGLCFMIVGFFVTKSLWGNPFNAFTFGSRSYNTPFGQVSSDKNGDNYTIKTKDGTLSAGAGIPKDFPKDVTIYPKAKPEGHFGGMVTFSTKDSPAMIGAFYETTMAAKGWEVSKSEIGDMQILTCTKGERTVSVTANPNTDKGLTDILIGFSK